MMIQFDDDKNAVINPWDIKPKRADCPKVVVTCFPNNLFKHAVEKYNATLYDHLNSTNGENPIYTVEIENQTIGLFMTSVGASKSVADYEELFALGVETIVVFGTCGVLDSSLQECAIIVPNIAYRDEGCSYHYLPASDTLDVNTNTMDDICTFFDSLSLTYHIGKVWTTDAFYRETKGKVEKMRADGFCCVDMECSAFAALAQFRGKRIAQFFYSADNLDNESWDQGSLANQTSLEKKKDIVDIAMGLGIYLGK